MAKKTRPSTVWLIVIYTYFNIAYWLPGYVSVSSIPLLFDPESEARILNNVRTTDFWVWFAQSVYYIAASITLFMMRKAALYMYAVALCGELGVLIWTLMDRSRFDAMGMGSNIMMNLTVSSLVVALLLFSYVLSLALSGQLRGND